MEIEQIEQSEITGGVILNPPVKQEMQYTYWFFTYNNYEEEKIEQLEQVFRHECKWYVFQKEIGKEGTPHLQGTICLKIKQRMTSLKKIDLKIHWEPTKSVLGSRVYCTKKDTSVGQVYSYGIDLPEELDLEEPYGWQLQVLKIIESKPDKRTIHWFWEPDGNVGKTTLCKYLCAKKNALIVTGKSSDMFHALAKNPKKRVIIIVDVPRSTQDFINYGAIEQIKNGLIFSGKYEGTQLVFNCPHVIVFANCKPEKDVISEDRWNIIKICK